MLCCNSFALSFPCYRKKAVEMELAKCKIDIMSLNSQLLDAIQQKLNLSQQLEAWQVRFTHTHQCTQNPSYLRSDQAERKSWCAYKLHCFSGLGLWTYLEKKKKKKKALKEPSMWMQTPPVKCAFIHHNSSTRVIIINYSGGQND